MTFSFGTLNSNMAKNPLFSRNGIRAKHPDEAGPDLGNTPTSLPHTLLATPGASKHSFAGPANRAFPVLRKLFEAGSLRDFAFPVAPIRIVDASAIGRLALVHLFRFGHLLDLS